MKDIWKEGRLSFIFVAAIVIASLVLIVVMSRSRAQSGQTPREIVPTAEQQQPIIDLNTQETRAIQSYNDQITGAIRMLMSALKDPDSGKPLRAEDGWSAESIVPNDISKGVKFVKKAQ